ncbi:hypothetical protein L21SP5_00222 [Salinivirga cyanobacteriivorans]|uniref:Uncharacterized protein n=1 Tax=Salinivirga cyanobacteriivorans TaxID=1307839 RepID=A0A0S2HV58_9BACT|nr:hypothetical protein L21SP5_00222 [Salinivirga cyanobacteriivorans]
MEYLPALDINYWDENGDGLIERPNTDYSNEMRAVWESFLASMQYDPVQQGQAYLFVIPGITEGGDVRGYMPIKSRYGFVTADATTRAVAHELGHGVFNLRHTFSEENSFTLPQGETDNLMDYSTGTELWKYQWDFIHNPEGGWHIFEDVEEGMIEIENGSFITYNGSINSNSDIFENDGFNLFYQTELGKTFVNIFTLRNSSVFPLYTNLAAKKWLKYKFSHSLKYYNGEEWISVSEISQEDILNLKICFFIQFYEGLSQGIEGAYSFSHEAFIHGKNKYLIAKNILENINVYSDEDIALALNRIIYTGMLEGSGVMGSKDHAEFLEGENQEMTEFIKQLLALNPNKKEEIFDELKTELRQYSNPIGTYEEIDDYFQNKYNKSSVEIVQIFLMNEFEEYYEEYFEDWYNDLVNDYNN